jgi:hypothetical protein
MKAAPPSSPAPDFPPPPQKVSRLRKNMEITFDFPKSFDKTSTLKNAEKPSRRPPSAVFARRTGNPPRGRFANVWQKPGKFAKHWQNGKIARLLHSAVITLK